MEWMLLLVLCAIYVVWAISYSKVRYTLVWHVVLHEPDPRVRTTYVMELFTLQILPITDLYKSLRVRAK